MVSSRVALAFLGLCAVISQVNGQALVDIKRLPKKITPTMCECAGSLRNADRDARRKAAQEFCSNEESLGIPDFEAEVKEEVRKKLPRGLAQWARKQVEAEGVDYNCLNTLREFYHFQKKLESFLEPIAKEKRESYARCFGKRMGWLKADTGELDKPAIRQEIAGSASLNPKLRQSLELLTLTCRGSKAEDLESYVKCASRPCVDAEFFDAVLKGSTSA